MWSQTIDVSVEEQVLDGTAAVAAHTGRIDCVVQNADIASMSPLHEMTTEM